MAKLEWNVKNAINRDVERQHLNKILKDIRESIDSLGGGGGNTTSTEDIRTIIASMLGGRKPSKSGGVEYNPGTGGFQLTLPDFWIRLVGDVSGEAEVKGLKSVSIPVTIDPTKLGVPEAPLDGQAYWRNFGEWEAVDPYIYNLKWMEGVGIAVLEENGEWRGASIEGTEEEIDVQDGDALLGNPVISLADLPNSGEGESPLKKYTRDSKGRISGDEEATTDDLPEGSNNLYFTEDRVEDVVNPLIIDAVNGLLDYESLKEVLVAGANVTLTADDLDETITITSTGSGGVNTVTGSDGVAVDNTDPTNPVVSLTTNVQGILANAVVPTSTPTDGDILEFNVTSSGWVPKKNPRELLIDGGNF